MATNHEVTVTIWDVNAFRAAPGDPHMIWDGAAVRIIPPTRLRDYPGALVIVTRSWLADNDPDMHTYAPEFAAAFLTDVADAMAHDRDRDRAGTGDRS